MSECPFRVGDLVRFVPSARTRGLYQNIEETRGVKLDEVNAIREIREGTYLYFDGGRGGWPWNEFETAE